MTPFQFIVNAELRLWFFMGAVFIVAALKWLAWPVYALGAWLVLRYVFLSFVSHRQSHGVDPQAPIWAQEVMAPMRGFFAVHLILALLFMGVLWSIHPLIT